jgi:BMFP domain-containing protein YqiC
VEEIRLRAQLADLERRVAALEGSSRPANADRDDDDDQAAAPAAGRKTGRKKK